MKNNRNVHVQAPKNYPGNPFMKKLFLAGGITNAPDWQSKALQFLEGNNLVIYNPRRKGNFRRNSAGAWVGIDPREQIKWEHERLALSDAILFWFPYPARCAITLFELGSWIKTRKPIFVGCHPKYVRKTDLQIQLGLEAPQIEIKYTLKELCEQTANFLNYWNKA